MKQITFKVFLLAFLFSLVAYCQTTQQVCKLQQNHVNKQILDNNVISCLQKALKNGWQDVIDYLVSQKEVDHPAQFIKQFQNEIKRLEILEQQIVLGTSQTQPTLKWGQNQTHIFLTFKLSHRWDSPPCLYTQSQKSQLGELQFSYDNVCLVSHQKINFKIKLNLHKGVYLSLKDSNNNGSIQTIFTQYTFQVKKDGVGTYSTILLKKVPQIWIFLTKQQKSYPLWHEIETRYQEDFKQYQRSLTTFKLIQKQKAASQSFQLKQKTLGLIVFMISWLLYS